MESLDVAELSDEGQSHANDVSVSFHRGYYGYHPHPRLSMLSSC